MEMKAIVGGAARSVTQGWFIALIFAVVLAVIGRRSFWMDEAMLGIALDGTSWSSLLRLQEYNQATPIGLALLWKSVLEVFGRSDVALRLGGVAAVGIAMWIFAKVARESIGGLATLLVLALVVSSFPMLRMITEFKHYAFEFAISLLLVGLWLRLLRTGEWKWYVAATILALPFTYSTPLLTAALFLGSVWAVFRKVSAADFGLLIRLQSVLLLAQLLWHFTVVVGSVEQQMKGFDTFYSHKLLSANPDSLFLWLTPGIAILVLVGAPVFLFFLAILPISFISGGLKVQGGLSEPVIVATAGLFVVIWSASLAGVYPIGDTRHFVFAAAIFIVALATLMSWAAKKDKGVLYGCLGSILVGGATSYAYSSKPFSEVKAVSERVAAVSGVQKVPIRVDFIEPVAQPSYLWYLGDATAPGWVNGATGLAESAGVVDWLPWASTTRGAWAALFNDNSGMSTDLHSAALLRHVIADGGGNILVSGEMQDAASQLASRIEDVVKSGQCVSQVVYQRGSTAVIRLLCDDSSSN